MICCFFFADFTDHLCAHLILPDLDKYVKIWVNTAIHYSLTDYSGQRHLYNLSAHIKPLEIVRGIFDI